MTFMAPNHIFKQSTRFYELDSRDNRNRWQDGFLDNKLFNVGYKEETKLILNNLYNPASPPYIPDNSFPNYRMSELGKYIAGEDGKISVNELKSLDTNNDNKLSQAEYDAKKAEMDAAIPFPPPGECQGNHNSNNSMQQMMQILMMLLQMFMGGGFRLPQSPRW